MPFFCFPSCRSAFFLFCRFALFRFFPIAGQYFPIAGQYFAKASPARQGDYIEWVADLNLLVALSACPFGDVSTPCGTPMEEVEGGPLKVEVFDIDRGLADQWKRMNESLAGSTSQ